jgi:hypothetical protein
MLKIALIVAATAVPAFWRWLDSIYNGSPAPC